MSYLRNKNDTDYPLACKQVYELLKQKYGYTIRITNIWGLMADVVGLNKFELIDTSYYQNGMFEAYLIDRLIDWQNGRDVDFSEVFNKILITGDFTMDEKLLFIEGDIEERLWGIFLAITNDNLNFN